MPNSKKKGNIWENKLAKWLSSYGVKAYKDGFSGGGNREKGDIINNLNMTIESKAAKNIKLMEWWEQVSKSASLQRNKPVLFIHQDGMPDNNWLVVMDSNDWIEHIQGENEAEIDNTLDWTQKNALDNLIRSCKEVLKKFDE